MSGTNCTWWVIKIKKKESTVVWRWDWTWEELQGGMGYAYNQNTFYVCMKDSKLINAILTSFRDEGGLPRTYLQPRSYWQFISSVKREITFPWSLLDCLYPSEWLHSHAYIISIARIGLCWGSRELYYRIAYRKFKRGNWGCIWSRHIVYAGKFKKLKKVILYSCVLGCHSKCTCWIDKQVSTLFGVFFTQSFV